MSQPLDPTRELLAPRKRAAPAQATPERFRIRMRWVVATVFFVGVSAGIALWRSERPAYRQASSPVKAELATPKRAERGAEPATVVPYPSVPLAEVGEILRTPKSNDWQLRRLRDNPSILVIEFPGLDEQGRAMNRMASMYEKRGGDRDRVADDSAMERMLRASGDSVGSFLQGHDYTGEMLARFFTLASAQRVSLNAHEQRLRKLLVDAAVLRADPSAGYVAMGTQAVISFTATQRDDPTTAADETVDDRRREAVLRHELSHGVFFTDAAYRDHCWDFWRHRLTERQRKLFRAYLEGQDYSPLDESLMVNEMQAMLMHTPDERAFSAAALGVSQSELARMRSSFQRSNPRRELRGNS